MVLPTLAWALPRHLLGVDAAGGHRPARRETAGDDPEDMFTLVPLEALEVTAHHA